MVRGDYTLERDEGDYEEGTFSFSSDKKLRLLEAKISVSKSGLREAIDKKYLLVLFPWIISIFQFIFNFPYTPLPLLIPREIMIRHPKLIIFLSWLGLLLLPIGWALISSYLRSHLP